MSYEDVISHDEVMRRMEPTPEEWKRVLSLVETLAEVADASPLSPKEFSLAVGVFAAGNLRKHRFVPGSSLDTNWH